MGVTASVAVWTDARARVSARVEAAYRKTHQPVPAQLQRDVTAMPLARIPPADALALLAYSYELYEDYQSPDPQQSRPFQLYKEFNALCRTYGHCEAPGAELEAEWGLFLPFAVHPDHAIAALPSVAAVLYRGMSRGSEAHGYPLGTRGAWGGCLSCSSDRQQGIQFVNKDRQLQSQEGSFFMILSDHARPIVHVSQFPEEMEHLHPLGLELEVCNVLPASILQMLSIKIAIITFKRVGAQLSYALWLRAFEELGFVYDEFLRAYVPPLVKQHPYAHAAFPIQDQVLEFVSAPDRQVLLITAKPGVWGRGSAVHMLPPVLALCGPPGAVRAPPPPPPPEKNHRVCTPASVEPQEPNTRASQ